MSTTRRRHFVTETDELGAALDTAATRWPELSRSQLIVRLALEGGSRAAEKAGARLHERRAALRRHAGLLTGGYEPGYLEHIREEWPE